MASATEDRSYEQILASKIVEAKPCGFEPLPMTAPLFDWQWVIDQWAVRKGRAALFCDTGLGKTPMQLEWASQVSIHTEMPVIILAPLAVSHQTQREGEKFGIPVTVCHSGDDVRPGVNVTNYERMHLFDMNVFGGVVLDESSILKSFMGKTKRLLIDTFEGTPYKLCCTATPAPNDHLELGNHAQFLGVMDSAEMISRWFINDTMSAGSYRLKEHGACDFWRWVATWAVCIGSPEDIGFDGLLYHLKPLNIHNHVVDVSHLPTTDGTLFRGAIDLSATGLHREMRVTAPLRARKLAEIINGSTEPWMIWCNTDYEADEILALVENVVEVRGSMSDEKKEDGLNGFAVGKYKRLLSKPSIAGFGLNYQHCAHVAFVGLSYSYEQFYQAIRRCWRFGQTRPVEAHVISAESEGSVLATIHRKERAHREMKARMIESMSEETVRQITGSRVLNTVIPSQKHEGEGWVLYHGDCVQVIRGLPSESIHYSVFSPPFSNLYIYSDSIADMGNSASDEEFQETLGHLAKELFRITVSGRNCSVHCKDLPLYKGRDGAAGLRDFPGELIRTFSKAGWTYASRVTIWKDPVIEMQRTKNHGLLFKQLRKDSSYSRQGMADFVLTFRKWGGEDSSPVAHVDDELATKDERGSPTVWQKWASPVWMDIDQTDVLNYQQARGNEDERHICPLQLGVIERCIRLWSNPGDVVFSPFAGIGSEGYVALQNRRRFIGVELKEEYVRVALRYLKAAANADQMTLFRESEMDRANG